MLVTASGKSFTGILPPPDLRRVIDKTVKAIAANASLEDKLKGAQRHNARFSFLQEGDAYAEYYQWRLKCEQDGDEVKDGKESAEKKADGAKVSSRAQPKQSAPINQKPEEIDPIQIELSRSFNEAPELDSLEMEWTLERAAMAAVDLDVMRLTALHTAFQPGFIDALRSREFKSAQFGFLNSSHSYHTQFTQLVDMYSRLGAMSSCPDIPSRWAILKRAQKEGLKRRERMASQVEDEEQQKRDRQTYLSIDWSEFILVNQMQFKESDVFVAMKAPLTLKQHKAKKLVDKSQDVENVRDQVEDGGQLQQVQPAVEPQQAMVPAQAVLPPGVRTDFVPSTSIALPQMMGVSPAGALVPIEQINKQIRVEQLHPDWKVKKDQAEAARAQTASLPQAGSADVSTSLKALAASRPDLFGSANAGQRARMDEEEQARISRQKESEAWDGSELSKEQKLKAGLTNGKHAHDAGEETISVPSKKSKKNVTSDAEGGLVPEASWLMMHPHPVSLKIQLPKSTEKAEWKYEGQVIEVSDIKLDFLVTSLRDRIKKVHAGSMAPNSRIRLTFKGADMKNAASLASFNIQDGDIVVMELLAAVQKKK